MIDLKDGRLTWKVYDEVFKMNVHNKMEYKEDKETTNNINMLDYFIEQTIVMKYLGFL